MDDAEFDRFLLERFTQNSVEGIRHVILKSGAARRPILTREECARLEWSTPRAYLEITLINGVIDSWYARISDPIDGSEPHSMSSDADEDKLSSLFHYFA